METRRVAKSCKCVISHGYGYASAVHTPPIVSRGRMRGRVHTARHYDTKITAGRPTRVQIPRQILSLASARARARGYLAYLRENYPPRVALRCGGAPLRHAVASSRYRVMHNASPPFPHPRTPACLAPARNRRDKNKPPMTVTANDPSPSRSRDLWRNFDAPISASVTPLARSFPAKYVTRADTSVPFHRAASPSREIRGVRNAARDIDGSVVCCIVNASRVLRKRRSSAISPALPIIIGNGRERRVPFSVFFSLSIPRVSSAGEKRNFSAAMRAGALSISKRFAAIRRFRRPPRCDRCT